MGHRITLEELKTKSDDQILYWIINDKWANLHNWSSPLSKRLEKILSTLMERIDNEKK